jgi:hypothetical protein
VGNHGREVGPGRAHLRLGSPLPAQISFLYDVFRIYHAPQHPVRYGEKERAVAVKDLGWIHHSFARPPRVAVDTFTVRFHLYAFLRPLLLETNERSTL